MKNSNAASKLALRIDRLMRRIHADLHPRAHEFDRHQVGPLGGMLLLTVGENEPVDVQTVANTLARDKSQISRLIQRFEQRGLLDRNTSAEDGRVSVMRLTDLGREQLTLIQDAMSVIVGELFAALSRQEQENFSKMLERVLDHR